MRRLLPVLIIALAVTVGLVAPAAAYNPPSGDWIQARDGTALDSSAYWCFTTANQDLREVRGINRTPATQHYSIQVRRRSPTNSIVASTDLYTSGGTAFQWFPGAAVGPMSRTEKRYVRIQDIGGDPSYNGSIWYLDPYSPSGTTLTSGNYDCTVFG